MTIYNPVYLNILMILIELCTDFLTRVNHLIKHFLLYKPGQSCLKIFAALESKWLGQISVVAQTNHLEALDCMKGTSEL